MRQAYAVLLLLASSLAADPAVLLTGNLHTPADPAHALREYTALAQRSGDPEAQYRLGFLYGTNYGQATGKGVEGVGDQGTSILYYTFAALSEHVPALMTVGYRHWVGIGTKQSCQDALGWYKSAADQALRTFNAGPPGGRHLLSPKVRLSDLQGGLYGPGASTSSRQSSSSSPETQQEWDDLIEFHLFHAERGDPTFMYRLGRLYYQGFGGGGAGGSRDGTGRLETSSPQLQDGLSEGGRDFNRASKWFMRVAKAVWPKDPPKEETKTKGSRNTSPAVKQGEGRVGYYDEKKDVKLATDEHFTMVAGLSAGYLGRMYLRGEGVRTDYAKAFLWFMRGSSQGDRESRHGLGIMFRDGLGAVQDLAKAKVLFVSAAQQDLASAQVALGKYFLGIGDLNVATQYFEMAIRQGDDFQSFYYLAEIAAMSSKPEEQCPSMVAFYKHVAERGDWDSEVWWEAERAFARGDEKIAFLGYWMMAERGYEVAQNNVAWILDRDKKRLRIPYLDKTEVSSNVTDRIALTYWTRSAAQDNVDALLKTGDYYYAGLGSAGGESVPELQKAASFYRSAANSHTSAMAMWNLGWLHETGRGVTQDFHLAKRYYDQALETSLDAYLPVTLALLSLRLRSLYHTLFIPTSAESPKPLPLFRSSPTIPTVDVSKSTPEQRDSSGKVSKAWSSIGQVWRDVQYRWGFGELEGGEGEGRNTAAETQRAVEGNDDLAADWARGNRDDQEEEFYDFEGDEGDLTSTLAIIALCLLLAFLLNFRQRRIPPEGQPPRPPPAQPAGEEAEGVDAAADGQF